MRISSVLSSSSTSLATSESTSGIAIILQMRGRMEEMNRQMQSFVEYVRTEMLARFQQAAPPIVGAIVPMRKPAVQRPVVVTRNAGRREP